MIQMAQASSRGRDGEAAVLRQLFDSLDARFSVIPAEECEDRLDHGGGMDSYNDRVARVLVVHGEQNPLDAVAAERADLERALNSRDVGAEAVYSEITSRSVAIETTIALLESTLESVKALGTFDAAASTHEVEEMLYTTASDGLAGAAYGAHQVLSSLKSHHASAVRDESRGEAGELVANSDIAWESFAARMRHDSLGQHTLSPVLQDSIQWVRPGPEATQKCNRKVLRAWRVERPGDVSAEGERDRASCGETLVVGQEYWQQSAVPRLLAELARPSPAARADQHGRRTQVAPPVLLSATCADRQYGTPHIAW